jgi:hypothetical protein
MLGMVSCGAVAAALALFVAPFMGAIAVTQLAGAALIAADQGSFAVIDVAVQTLSALLICRAWNRSGSGYYMRLITVDDRARPSARRQRLLKVIGRSPRRVHGEQLGRALTLEVDHADAARLVSRRQLGRRRRAEADPSGHAVELDALRGVHRVAPDVVEELAAADDPADDVPDMDADPHRPAGGVLADASMMARPRSTHRATGSLSLSSRPAQAIMASPRLLIFWTRCRSHSPRWR